MSSPAITYQDIVKDINFLSSPSLEGGMSYQNEPYGPGRIQYGTVHNFDCHDFVQADHVGYENRYIKKITFSNGLYIEIGIFVTDGVSLVAPLTVNLESFLSDGTYTDWYQNIQYTLTNAVTGAASTAELLQQYGFSIYFITDYLSFHVDSVPIENITVPDWFKLELVFSGFNPLGGEFYENNIAGLTTDALVSVGYDEFMSKCYTNEGGTSLYTVDIIMTDDLDAWIAELARRGGEVSDPYTTGSPIPKPPQDDDPSEVGGGDGEYDPESDPVDFPDVPTGGALSSGAIKAFVVGSATIKSMFLKLWDTSIFDPSNFQKLLESPLDALISLHCLPFTPTTGNTETIKLGNYDFGGTISAPVISSQYATIDCGTLKPKLFWGSALDFDPYTKIDIFLPFIGIKQLNPSDVMNTTVSVKYNVDVLTGDLTAQIKCGQSVLYKFQGNCKAMIPISARMSEVMANLIKGAGHMTIGAAAGGLAGAGAAAINAGINTALSKTNIVRSGDLSGSVGLLDHFIPYLIVHRPKQSLAQNFGSFRGYPSNITKKLGTVSGYTKVKYIHLTGIDGATDTELNEIETLLKRGVII